MQQTYGLFLVRQTSTVLNNAVLHWLSG